MKPYVFIALYVHDIIVMLTTDPGGGSSPEILHPVIDYREVFK